MKEMKDLKHYFTDAVKASEASNENKEVTTETSNGIATSEEQAKGSSSPTSMSTRKKRGRVKIKISQNNGKGTICDIVESKSDLVDKTPSPFAPLNVKVDESTENETPKRSNSIPRKSTKISHLKVTNKTVKSESEDKSPDENDNNTSKAKVKSGKPDAANGRAIFAEHAANTDISAAGREASNAFQVLMTRQKQVQYNLPATLTQQEEEAAAKAAEENRIKLKQNKEKLVAMADKKGYSKRKIEELEEAEKIEKRLEKRAKVFKQMGKKESDEKNLGRRISPGSLHNYFSKTTPEQKELTGVSTLVVQAEVHTSDSASLVMIAEKQGVQMVEKEENEEIFEVLAPVDEVTIESENMSTPETSNEQKQTNLHRKKPKWSLRINLTGNGAKIDADVPAPSDDKIARGKRESRHRKSKTKATNYEENEDSEAEAPSSKSSGRKKKSSGNTQKNKSTAKADEPMVIELDMSDVKKAEAAKISEIDIIEVKDTHRTKEKLAPLFVKRQKPDPAVLEARRLFLHSVPVKNENSKTERKAPIQGASYLPFPVISHVSQIGDESKIVIADVNKFTQRNNSYFTPSINLNELKSVTSLNNNSVKNSNDIEMAKENVEEMLNEIESRCSDAREIWKQISVAANGEETTRASPKKKGKKRKSNEKKMEIIDAKTCHSCTFTQKYRPLSTREIVGNEEAAEKLRKWLEGWKAPLRKDDYSSGDEFYSSDCSYASNFDNNQVAVLLGPHGSGKTASVYAVAAELGYSILEINASSKRGGKKILKELEEATKSHRIKKPDAMSLMREKKALPQNSLILVEDVDLIFDEDEGFISATCQLASNTKRPIVFTGRDTCSHLNRMAPQQHRIYYQTTAGSRVSALLELITLAESSYRLPQPCLDRLLQNGDLRKALLQLQYLLLSGKPRASEVPSSFHQSLWQDMRYCIYKPAIKSTRKSTKKKLADSEQNPQNDKTVMGLAKDLDRLSFVSTLIEIEDPALEISTLKLEPSLSLDENIHAYSSTKITSVEIARWLRDRLMAGKTTADSNDNSSQILRQLSMKKELNSGVNFAFSQVSPQTLDSRAMTIDYLPSLRTICRAEETRVSVNSKRGNRFYHYLQSLRLPITSTRPNILAAACKMMRDKSVSES